MEAILARRFSPLNFLAIPGFPNHVPTFIECADLLPMFQGDEGDNPAQYLIGFHQCIDRLNIHHEDALMKVFVYSLHGDARKWYHSLPVASISSLQEFHATFHKYARRYYSSDKLLEGCCETYKFYIQQEEECSSCDELSDDPIESKSEDEIEFSDKDVDEDFSLSNSREDSLLSTSHDCTNDFMNSDMSYPVDYAPDLSDFKEEPIVEKLFFPFLQEVSYDLVVPEIEQEDQQNVHFPMQERGVQDSPVFDQYPNEEELISTKDFVDLRSNPPIYDIYESNLDGEQFNHPEIPVTEFEVHVADPETLVADLEILVADIKNSSLEISDLEVPAADIEETSSQISKHVCNMFELRSEDKNKQIIISSEVSLQPCPDLQTVVDVSLF